MQKSSNGSPSSASTASDTFVEPSSTGMVSAPGSPVPVGSTSRSSRASLTVTDPLAARRSSRATT